MNTVKVEHWGSSTSISVGVNSTDQGFSVEDTMTDNSCFNISEIKLYNKSDTPNYDIIWTENSDVINSFILEILKYESSVIVSSTEKPWSVLFTPILLYLARKKYIIHDSF